jgi:hypothetical protein
MTLQPSYWKLHGGGKKEASIPPALIHSGKRQGIRLHPRLVSVVVPLAEDVGQHSSSEELVAAPVAIEDSQSPLSQEEREYRLLKTCSMMDLYDVTPGSSLSRTVDTNGCFLSIVSLSSYYWVSAASFYLMTHS